MNSVYGQMYICKVHDDNWAGLDEINSALKTIINLYPYKVEFHCHPIVDNNDVFSITTVYEDGDDYSEPLFRHNKLNFTITWYKHPGRGLKWSPITIADLRQVVIDCLSVYNDKYMFPLVQK